MNREFPQAAIFGVGAIILHRGRVLLARRAHAPMRGKWTLPGGAVELGETSREAIIREVHEETGLSVHPVALVEIVDRIDRRGSRIRFHYVIADFLCFVDGGIAQANSDASAIEWLRPAQWRSGALNLDAVTLRVIEKAWSIARDIQRKGKR
ncbi:MAG: NUDIX hydrolase [Acidobacteriota bacterium]|nr:NUDIX hydrolase [Acidobacteriota bacterium]